MKLFVVSVSAALCLPLTACTKDSPTSPDPPGATTRIIRLGGDLNFGNVSVASAGKDGALTVSNDGNDTLQVTSIGGPCAGTYLTAQSATSFTVSPGATQSVGFRFAPNVRVNCTGTITVFGNQTSGTNTIAVTARGVQPGCEQIPDPLPPGCAP